MDIDASPETLLSSLSDLNAALADALAFLTPLLAAPLGDTLHDLHPLDRAKLYIAVCSAIDTITFVFLRTQGINPRDHPVMQELERIKLYVAKVKSVEGSDKSQNAWRIDKAAAGRFIRAGLAGNEEVRKKSALEGGDEGQDAEDAEGDEGEGEDAGEDEDSSDSSGEEKDEVVGFLEKVLSRTDDSSVPPPVSSLSTSTSISASNSTTPAPATPATPTPAADDAIEIEDDEPRATETGKGTGRKKPRIDPFTGEVDTAEKEKKKRVR
ncbi:hypothetical protein M427DRAFT_54268 [Gonapodya prolifera JEL478]|uniref:Exosome complex protein n=1 Tax=Gonapodya prolifera (strain JEL478) TaxID=1344416 RepID=A0A139AMB3_GONPJ|nr:hypothetical protein M427DRAFT_54268 [Gonapodya prolifera JEL478]|eukprot:KXS17663.1 hypothetical protein M427DRAFT_54268 [Gonapodya prolifera JEL478]